MPVPQTPAPVDVLSGRHDPLTRGWARLGLFAMFGGAVLHSRLVYAPCDDAYIFYVYAKNFVAGNGLTFNGEIVWGFTSTVWMFLVTTIGLLGIPIHVGAEILSLLTGWFALWATYRLGRAFSLGRLQALLPPLLLAATGDFAFYIGIGLEQALFLGLCLLAAARVIRERSFTVSRLAGTAAIMAAAILTRPEGGLLCGLLLLFWAARLRRLGPPLRCGLLLSMFVALVHVPLCAHFREFVPNTYFAKGDGGFTNLRHGLNYLAAFLPRYLPVFVALGLGLLYRWVRRPAWSRSDSIWMIGISFIWMGYIAYRGGDNMVGGRLFLPVVSFLFVTVVVLLRGLPSLRLAGLTVFLGAILVVGYQVDDGVARHAEGWRQAFRVRRAAAIHLRENYPPDTVVALNPAGVIPYITGMPTIDMLGLNHPHIAKKGRRDRSLRFGHQAGDGEYVLEHRPDVILFVALSAEPGPFISDREIWATETFHEDYVPVRWTGIGTAYVRKDRQQE